MRKQAKEDERRYQNVRTQLEDERETAERCQGIAKALNIKLYRIRSLLEEAAVSAITLMFFKYINYEEYTFFIGNSIFHLSLELLTKFWKTSLKVV